MAHQRTPSLSPTRERPHYARALAVEYIRKTYPRADSQLYVRIGPIIPLNPPADEGDFYICGYHRSYAMAVMVLPDKLVVLHAALNPKLDDVARAGYLRDLAHKTPEFERWLDRPVEARLLYVFPCLGLREEARAHNVRLSRFVPSFLRQRARRAPRRRGRGEAKKNTPPSPL